MEPCKRSIMLGFSLVGEHGVMLPLVAVSLTL